MPFMRIILPLVIAAAFIYAPLLEQNIVGEFTGPERTMVTGATYVGAPVDCAFNLQFNPLDEDCAPKHGLKGWAVYAAVAIGLIAAIVGVLGLLPFIRGISGLLTTAAGVAGAGASGTLLFEIWKAGHLPDVQWGMWVALGVSILTILVGMSSMSSSD